MMDATIPARDALMEKLMRANSLLLQMKKHSELAPNQEQFAALLPHLEAVLAELASYVFFAPPQAPVTPQNLIEYMALNQEQTLDIYRFEAYKYLIEHIG